MSWFLNSVQQIPEMDSRLTALEEMLSDFTYNTSRSVQSALEKTSSLDVQSNALYGMRLALCVDTKDPWGQGRVKFYHPLWSNKNTPVESLPWANSVSVLGGFDDSGALWVPPAGSEIVIFCESGNRGAVFYLGTIWNRDRGEPPHNWGYGIPEYQCIHEGHRKGYFVGANDESQVFPPSNTENSNIKDIDDIKAFEQDTEALRKVTPSHIYEIKTPEKHRLKFDDGNYYCNHRWKRVELGSSGGATFLMWDDHMHAAGQHAHPKACSCGPNATGGAGTGIDCGKTLDEDSSGCRKDTETPECGDHEYDRCKNELFKHESEVRAFRGPCTPQNNKCQLEQTGVFLSSISGHVFVMDDEVSDPEGAPNWERGVSPFPFGCENKFYGKMYLKTATGHMIKMSDVEDEKNVRAGEFNHLTTGEWEPNGIQIKTATGHQIEMNDHTLNSGRAGDRRGIRIASTSGHELWMSDDGNDQKSPNRKEGGFPEPKANKALVRLKTGYGLQLLMRDDSGQGETAEKQFIELLAPNKQNDYGPHLLRMQEAPPQEPGFVLLRTGGQFIGQSAGDWVETVGLEDTPGYPANKLTTVSRHDIHETLETYVYLSDVEFHHAKRYIILGAGEDCPPPEGAGIGETPDPKKSPCLYPVLVWSGGVGISDRVYASAGVSPVTLNPVFGWITSGGD